MAFRTLFPRKKVRKAKSNVLPMPDLRTKNGPLIVAMLDAMVEVAVVVAVVVVVAGVQRAAVVVVPVAVIAVGALYDDHRTNEL